MRHLMKRCVLALMLTSLSIGITGCDIGSIFGALGNIFSSISSLFSGGGGGGKDEEASTTDGGGERTKINAGDDVLALPTRKPGDAKPGDVKTGASLPKPPGENTAKGAAKDGASATKSAAGGATTPPKVLANRADEFARERLDVEIKSSGGKLTRQVAASYCTALSEFFAGPQKPEGMVKLTVAEVREILSEKCGSLRKPTDHSGCPADVADFVAVDVGRFYK